MTSATLVEGNLVHSADHPEWGIGLIDQIDGASALVRFYQGSERVEHCPLAALRHHRYAVNDQIFAITESAYGIVLDVREIDGLVTYSALFGNRRKGIPETNILPRPVELEPFDLLLDEASIDARAFTLALQARRLLYAYRYDELVCLSNARIELLPHQVFVTDRVLRDYPHRFLLSDEVGLGKTIEAGLILKELRAREAARRVLIVVPAGLVTQWVEELRKKFNESFTRIDSTNMAAHVSLCGSIDQVWQTYPSIVTSLHMLRTNEAYIEALAAQEWDLIIFDEAHHLRRHLERRRFGARSDQDERRTTAAYRLAQQLQGRTTSLLLLTATPLQLHTFELYSLVELLDPVLFADFADFERYRTQVPRLNRIARQLDRYTDLGGDERWTLANDLASILHDHPRGDAPRLSEILVQLETDAAARIDYQARIADLHRLARVLIRNRKREVFDDLQPRRARILSVAFSPAERAAYDAVTDYLQHWYNLALEQHDQVLGFLMITYRKILTSSSYALRQSFRKRIARLTQIRRAGRLRDRREQGEIDPDEVEELDELLERFGDVVLSADPALIDAEIAQVEGLCAALDQITVDTKAQRLMEELAAILQNPQEKVLIFTQFKETLFYLKGMLEQTYAVTVFYGGMDAAVKDEAVDDFHNSKQIMIATEAAGEGRNLQFCHIMFNYDLPWNPMKIEQRIGRLDRIGQHAPVQIFNFAVDGTIEQRVLQVLHERINIFESVVGTLDPILESIEQDVRDLVFGGDGGEEERVRQFAQRVADRVREVQQMEERLADFLLDRSSFRRDRADALLGRTPAFSSADIQRFLAGFLEHVGGQMRERSTGVYDLTIPRRMQTGSGTGSDLRDGYRVTFDAALAQQHERLDFVAFGHPLLDRAVDFCQTDDFGGRAAYLTITTDEVPSQQAIVAIYKFTFEGIRPRRAVHAFAVALDGSHLPELSAQFLTLTAQARPSAFESVMRQAFDRVLDHCREAIKNEASAALERERRVQDMQNRREYELIHRKLTRFYGAQRLSLEREIQRLERLLEEQQRSSDPNVRRVIPATQGRVTAAQRQRDELEAERERRLSNLSRQRTVVAAEELLAAAYAIVEPVVDKDSAHAS